MDYSPGVGDVKIMAFCVFLITNSKSNLFKNPFYVTCLGCPKVMSLKTIRFLKKFICKEIKFFGILQPK
jgi:hypothetical protein